jgi:hypothetical protein
VARQAGHAVATGGAPTRSGGRAVRSSEVRRWHGHVVFLFGEIDPARGCVWPRLSPGKTYLPQQVNG